MRFGRAGAAVGAFLVCFTGLVAGGRAYEIGSAVSYPCHESLTRRSFDEVLAAGAPFEEEDIPLPLDSSWSRVFDAMGRRIEASYDSEANRFVAFSLILGARFPDVGHNSVFDANSMHDLHSHPGRQHAHCLRSSEDDWAAGEQWALERCYDAIRAGLERAAAEQRRPREEQLLELRTYVNFYGHIDVDVWSPAFELGKTLHTVQDSFSHTVRSDDLHKIRHVMNALEVGPRNQPNRDGLVHSLEMDECDDGAGPIAEVVVDVGADFLRGASNALRSDDPTRLEPFFETWMSYEKGCGVENDFCGSKWAQLARTDPSTTFMDCSADPSSSPSRRAGRRWIDAVVVALRLLLS